MAKYGLFNPGEKQPVQTVEGTSMIQNGDHVYIYKKAGIGGPRDVPQVGAIKLGDGQCMKLIE